MNVRWYRRWPRCRSESWNQFLQTPWGASKKNEMKPWLKSMWCIPPEQDAAFVAAMEQVLTVYHRPHDLLFPVVNMDEQPIQLISHSRPPLPIRPGDTAKVDYEYTREGMCNAFMFVQPLGGWREVHVSATKTAVDWARYVKWLVDLLDSRMPSESRWFATTSTHTRRVRSTPRSRLKKRID